MEELKVDELSDIWYVWYHHVNDDNWNEDSYTKVCELKTVEDYWKLMNTIDNYTSGMFFIMRESVFPRWEDINNMDGGYWTFRVAKKDSNDIWSHMLAHIIGNTLTKKADDMEIINGISISPKINNCIIKIWNNDYKLNDPNILNDQILGINLSDAIYRKHQDQTDLVIDRNLRS